MATTETVKEEQGTAAGWSGPAKQDGDPTAALVARVTAAQKAFADAEAARTRVFGTVYEAGALTLGQMAEATGLTESVIRSITLKAGGTAEERKEAAARAALAALDE